MSVQEELYLPPLQLTRLPADRRRYISTDLSAAELIDLIRRATLTDSKES